MISLINGYQVKSDFAPTLEEEQAIALAIGYPLEEHYREFMDFYDDWEKDDVKVYFDNSTKKLIVDHEKSNLHAVEDVSLWCNIIREDEGDFI